MIKSSFFFLHKWTLWDIFLCCYRCYIIWSYFLSPPYGFHFQLKITLFSRLQHWCSILINGMSVLSLLLINWQQHNLVYQTVNYLNFLRFNIFFILKFNFEILKNLRFMNFLRFDLIFILKFDFEILKIKFIDLWTFSNLFYVWFLNLIWKYWKWNLKIFEFSQI